jgi:hypothetical protein
MNEGKEWATFVDNNRDLAVVVADAMPHQVELMERGYADGLVGQLPYQSGEVCIDTLLQLQESGNPERDPDNELIFGTNLSLLLRVPLMLPEVRKYYDFQLLSLFPHSLTLFALALKMIAQRRHELPRLASGFGIRLVRNPGPPSFGFYGLGICTLGCTDRQSLATNLFGHHCNGIAHYYECVDYPPVHG